MVDASMMASEPLNTNNAEPQLLNVEPQLLNAEPQPSSLVEGGAFETEIASDEMTFDEILDLYDEAKTLQLGDYSEAQFDVVMPKGSELFGQIGPHEVSIPQNNPHHFPPKQQDGSTAKDIGRGVVLGVEDAATDMNQVLRDFGSNNILATYIGLPVDMMTKLANIIGFDIQEPVGGSANLKKGLDNFSGWVAENIPGVSEAGEFFSEFTAQKPDSEIVQSLVQGITKFGAGAVSGPVQFVRLLGMKNVILRGFAWGGITDWILGAGKDQTGAGQLIEAIDGLEKDERTGFAEAVYSVLAKQGNDSKYMRRAKATLDGFVAGGIAEGVIKLVTKAAKAVPWKTMLQKSATPVVQEQPALNVPVMKETPAATDLDAQGFFSAVSRAVDALPMDKGSASQMRAMIAKGEGVKAEEMAWIGLDEFLKGRKNVTKAEIKEYINANQVQIEEVVRTDEGVTQNISFLRRRYDMMVEGSGDYANLPPSLRKERAEKMLADIKAMEADNVAGPTKFGEYTLPGGENYREVLLKLPVERRMSFEEFKTEYRNRFMGKDIDPSKMPNPTDAELREYYDKGIEIPGAGSRTSEVVDVYKGGHFDEPNVLAHIRLNDRTGPNGEKILFIEEIQSDWHQKGRKEGYKTPTGNLSAEKMEKVGGEVWEVRDQSGQFITNITSPTARVDNGELVEFDIKSAEDAILIAQEQLDDPAAYNLGAMKTRVPDAPLKKTWHETSFRRVARMAAQEGYDAIAWTPGKMQAERYDLSKQVDELIVERAGDSFALIGNMPGGGSQNLGTFKSADLESVVGKDLAAKIKAQPEGGDVYNAADLQVGGEGMKGFYDQMLKKYAEKWGKKFASKVGVTEIITNPKIFEYENRPFIDRAQVWTLPITKKMRDSVLKKGVPLFSAAGAATVTGAAMQGNDNQI